MKNILILMLAFFMINANAQSSGKTLTEIRYNNKTYYKEIVKSDTGKTYIRITEKESYEKLINDVYGDLYCKYMEEGDQRAKRGYGIRLRKEIHLLNSDDDLKNAIKSVLTKAEIKKLSNEIFYVGPCFVPETLERLYLVMEFRGIESELGEMPDAKLIKLMEKIYSTLKFYIPDNPQIPVYEFSLPIDLSKVLSDEPLLRPEYYRVRQVSDRQI